MPRWVYAAEARWTKKALYVFNVLSMLSGVALLAMGIYTVTVRMDFDPLVADRYYSHAPSTFIVFGVCMVTWAIFGLVGTYREMRVLLIYFALFLTLTFGVLIMAATFCFMYRNQVVTHISDDGMRQSLLDYAFPLRDSWLDGEERDITEAWDTAQTKFECCGVSGPRDWLECCAHYIPDSCCKPANTSGLFNCTAQLANQRGCAGVLKPIFRDHAQLLGILGASIAVILFITVVLSLSFCKKITDPVNDGTAPTEES